MELSGARAVVLGRSILVGKPMAQLLLAANATVTHCHSRTRDLGAVCREADVLVAAVGSAGLVTGDMVGEGAVVIDVGTNRTDDGLVGDVDFEAAAERARRDHAGAGRRGADDARDAAREHAEGRRARGTANRTSIGRAAALTGTPPAGSIQSSPHGALLPRRPPVLSGPPSPDNRSRGRRRRYLAAAVRSRRDGSATAAHGGVDCRGSRASCCSCRCSWPGTTDGRGGSRSALLDVILAVVALAALAIPVATAAYRVPALPLALQSLTALVGILALLSVLVRVAQPAGLGERPRVGPVARRSCAAAGVVGGRPARDARRAALARGPRTRTSAECPSRRRPRSRRSRRRGPRPARDVRAAAARRLGRVRGGARAPLHDGARLVQHAGRRGGAQGRGAGAARGGRADRPDPDRGRGGRERARREQGAKRVAGGRPASTG